MVLNQHVFRGCTWSKTNLLVEFNLFINLYLTPLLISHEFFLHLLSVLTNTSEEFASISLHWKGHSISGVCFAWVKHFISPPSDTFFWADYKWLKIHLPFAQKPRKVSDARIQMSSMECFLFRPRNKKIETFQSTAYFQDKYCQFFTNVPSDEKHFQSSERLNSNCNPICCIFMQYYILN